MLRFAHNLIPATIAGFVFSFVLYEFFDHGAVIANGFLGKVEGVLAMLFFPGILFSALLGGNVHTYSLGLAFFVNGAIYSFVFLSLFKLKRRLSGEKL